MFSNWNIVYGLGVTEQIASDDTRKHVGEMTVLKKLTIYISYQHELKK